MEKAPTSKIFQLKIGELQNTGLPITTAMLIAYEILKRSEAASIQVTSQKHALRLAQNIGDITGTLLRRTQIQGGVTIAREEPIDPEPGCVEAPGSACEWPKGPGFDGK